MSTMAENRICQESFKSIGISRLELSSLSISTSKRWALSQGGSLPKDRDASTIIGIVDNEAPGNGTVDTLPTKESPNEKQPASETAAHDSPVSGHSEGKSNKPPSPEYSKQSPGTTSTEPMSVPVRRKLQATLAEPSGTETTQLPTGTKPESNVTALAQTPTVTTAEVINITPAQLREDIARVIKEMKTHDAEFPETVEAKQTWLQRLRKFGKSRLLPLSDQAKAILVAEYVSAEERIATAMSLQDMDAAIDALVEKQSMARAAIAQAKAADQSKMPQTMPAQTPTETKSEMVKTTTAQLPEDIGQATETMEAFQAESPETVQAKSDWLRRFNEFKIRMHGVNVPMEDVQRVGLLSIHLGKKRETIAAAITEAKIAEPQTTSAQIPAELQEAITQVAQRAEKLKTLRRTVARLPEIAKETKLPLALKERAAKTVRGLKTSRISLPMHLQRHAATLIQVWEAGQAFSELNQAERVIIARLKLTGNTVEEPAAGKHTGPTYPWGIFKKVEEAAKTTKDYEVSIARRGLEEREANLRDATGAQLSLKIKFLLRSISAQCSNLGLDLVLQGTRSG